jgi:hypothetical protein
MYLGRPRMHRSSTHSHNAVLALGAGGVVLLACGMTIKHLFGAVSRPLWTLALSLQFHNKFMPPYVLLTTLTFCHTAYGGGVGARCWNATAYGGCTTNPSAA